MTLHIYISIFSLYLYIDMGFFFLRQGLIHSSGWPQTCDPPAAAFQMLGLHV
jgi:hypothetical protein